MAKYDIANSMNSIMDAPQFRATFTKPQPFTKTAAKKSDEDKAKEAKEKAKAAKKCCTEIKKVMKEHNCKGTAKEEDGVCVVTCKGDKKDCAAAKKEITALCKEKGCKCKITVEKTASKYESCVVGLAKISELLDDAGFSKAATYAVLSLDALVSEAAAPTGKLDKADGDAPAPKDYSAEDYSKADDGKKDDDDNKKDEKDDDDKPEKGKKGVNPFAKKDDDDKEDDKKDDDDDDKKDKKDDDKSDAHDKCKKCGCSKDNCTCEKEKDEKDEKDENDALDARSMMDENDDDDSFPMNLDSSDTIARLLSEMGVDLDSKQASKKPASLKSLASDLESKYSFLE